MYFARRWMWCWSFQVPGLFVMVLIFSLDFKFTIHPFQLLSQSYLAVNHSYLYLLWQENWCLPQASYSADLSWLVPLLAIFSCCSINNTNFKEIQAKISSSYLLVICHNQGSETGEGFFFFVKQHSLNRSFWSKGGISSLFLFGRLMSLRKVSYDLRFFCIFEKSGKYKATDLVVSQLQCSTSSLQLP